MRAWIAAIAVVSIAAALVGQMMSQPATMPSDGAARVAQWRGDRKAAVSLTFDDGLYDQVEHAVPILNKAGIKGTFALNPGALMATKAEAEAKPRKAGQSRGASWEDWAEVGQGGHEIANHSMTHPKLTTLDAVKLAREVGEAHAIIEEKTGAKVVSFIYPFNAQSATVREEVFKKHIAASGGERAPYGYGKDAATHNARVDAAIEKGEWMIAMIHAIKQGYAAFPDVEAFRTHVAYLKGKQDVVWVDTMGNVAKYKKERENASIKAKVDGKSATVTLTCTLDAKVYDQPLTVVVATGATPKKAEATRGGAAITATVRGGDVLVDIVPGAEAVVVTWE